MGCAFGRVASRVVLVCVLVFGGAGVGFGQVVINEIMYDPNAVADTHGEWIELHNTDPDNPVSIENWVVSDAGTSSTTSFTITADISIIRGGYVVLARRTTGNGGFTPDFDYNNSFNLNNSGGDTVTLTDNNGMEQDEVIYDDGTDFPDASGASLSLIAPDLDTSMGENWCLATTEYGTGTTKDFGTPGMANDCPIPAPSIDCSGGTEIHVIQGSLAASPCTEADGMATTTDNIVTAVGAGGFFMQTPTARSDSDADTSDGIFVLYDGTTTINVGDQVDVVGTVEEFFATSRGSTRRRRLPTPR